MRNRMKAAFIALLLATAGVGVAASPAQATPRDPNNPVVDHGTPAGIKLADKPLVGNTKAPKGPPPDTAQNKKSGQIAQLTTDCSTVCYKYAGKYQTGITGAEGPQIAMTVNNPGLLSYDYHSLAEVLAKDSSGNTVEIGWIVNDAMFGDLNAHLFMFHWINGVPQGYGTNFVPVASPVKSYGSILTNGSTITLDVRHFTNAQCGCTAGWWLAYNSSFIGVYPDTLWTGAGQTFVTSPIVDAYGEATIRYDPSQTDIGSGQLATSAVGAQMATYGLFGAAPSTPAWNGTSLTQGLRWNVAMTGAGQNFRYGGPGGTNEIVGSVANDFCSGVASVGNGESCAYGSVTGSGTGTTPGNRRWSLDDAGSTVFCWQNLGTAGGYGGTAYVGLAGYKKLVVYNTTNCTGSSATLDANGTTNNVVAMPAGFVNLANLSVKISATTKTCATGYPGTPPTC